MPYERERTLYNFTLQYGGMLAADLEPEQMTAQPTPHANTPAWQFGHLAIAAEMTLRHLGQSPKCPRAWFVMFGRESSPNDHHDRMPGKGELLDALADAHKRLAEATTVVDEAQLAVENPMAEMRPVLPTLGDLVAHVMTTHEAMHLGQLAAWRRAMGLPRVF